MAREHLFERVGDLADGGARPGGLDRELEQVGVAGRAVAQPLQRGLACAPRRARHAARRGARAAARGPSVLSTSRTSTSGSSLEAVLVDADDDLVAPVDARLPARRGFLDAQLRHARLDRLRHAAERLDLLDELPRLVGEAVRERLDVVAAAERVDDVGDARLLGEDQLRVARDARRELARERDRLVERVGVQALRAAEHRGERLDRGAHDVVVRVLLGERHARRLAVRAQHQRRRLLRVELADERATRAGARRAASPPP